MSEDSDLLRRYSENSSEEAFAEVVRRHLGLVYGAALRKVGGDAHLAQDVTQQVFIDLARKAGRLSTHPSLIGWLFTSAHYAATQRVRAERRRRAREQKAHIMNEITSTPAEEVDWERFRPALDDLVLGLNERDRTAVLLRFFSGRTLAEVGSALGLTEEGARSRIDRALDKLRTTLARRGIRSTSVVLTAALAIQTGMAAPAGFAATVTAAAISNTGAVTGFGAGAWGLFNLMSTTKIVSGMAVITLLALSAAVYQTTASRVSAASIAALTHERDALRARLAAVEKRSTPTGRTLVGTDQGVAQPSAGAKPPGGSGRSEGRLEYALDHPEARSALLARAALTVKARFDRFFRSAGLTGAQQDKFLEIAMDDAEGRLDVLALKKAAGGLGPDAAPLDPATIAQMGALQQQKDDQTLSAFRGLLGDQFGPAMSYLNTISQRNTADELASQLYYTDAPLTGQQADQLTQVLTQNPFHAQATASPANTMGGTYIPREFYNGARAAASLQDFPWMTDVPVTDAALTQAATVLSPPQMAALSLLQAQQAAELQLAPVTTHSEPKK
jgi:RNA polymerase sigma factor (sigma-70 family)